MDNRTHPRRRLLAISFLFLAFASLALADIKVSTLNCYLLFSPANVERTAMKREVMPAETYRVKVEHLASMIAASGADIVGLQEIGSKAELTDLSRALSQSTGKKWSVCFVQGRDTYTGEDVGALVCERPGLHLVKYQRVPGLSSLSKHLVVTLVADGKDYHIAVVHLIRPIRESGIEKHGKQLMALDSWVRSQSGAVVVMGDFNDTGKALLGLRSAGELTHWSATHLSGKSFDNIYSLPAPTQAMVQRPRYPKKPNKLTVATWTDHYLLEATVP
jgi:hypothetical protein